MVKNPLFARVNGAGVPTLARPRLLPQSALGAEVAGELPVKRSALPLLMAAVLASSGCAASIAASVVGAAVQAANPPPPEVAYSTDLLASAREACRARAATHGEVHIIDAEQGRRGRVTVWGTVQAPVGRRAFTCTYNGAVSSFRLRAIPPRQ